SVHPTINKNFVNINGNESSFVVQGFLGSLNTNIVMEIISEVPGAQGRQSLNTNIVTAVLSEVHGAQGRQYQRHLLEFNGKLTTYFVEILYLKVFARSLGRQISHSCRINFCALVWKYTIAPTTQFIGKSSKNAKIRNETVPFCWFSDLFSHTFLYTFLHFQICLLFLQFIIFYYICYFTT
ncbi:hypothetical protein TSAR_001302, partial [Trichomalopsis sarcophagae]